jgi:iron complex outermembrane receptor protein
MSLRGIVALCLLAMLWLPARAQTLARETEFQVAGGPMAEAIIRFSEQSGLQLMSGEPGLTEISTPGVQGRLPIAEGLERLLQGTGLSYRQVGEDTIVISKAARSAAAAAARTPRASANARRAQMQSADPASMAERTLEEVIVTAEKRPRLLHDTALSVTVLNADVMERRGISSFTDLFSGAVPSLRVASQIGRTSALAIGMRGIHSGDVSQISRDAGVGIYTDGIYLGRSQGLSVELQDVERIEVLRGPQGTLFGRNAMGGAVSVVTRRPLGEYALQQTVGVHDRGGLRTALSVDLPRVGDLALKVDGTLREQDGLVRNPQPDAWDYGQLRRRGVRAQLLWQPAGDLDLLYAFDAAADDSAPFYLHLTEVDSQPENLAPLFNLETRPVRTARTAVPLEPSRGRIGGHALTLSWRLSGALELKSLAAWRRLEQSQFDNWAGATEAFAPLRLFARASIADLAQKQFSHELQLIATTGAVEWIAGSYFFVERASDQALEFFSNQFNEEGTEARVVRADASGVPVSRASTNHSRSRALFGQASWRLPVAGNRLTATAGARYTRDDKHGQLTLLQGEPAPPEYRYRFHSSRLDPSLSLVWDWTPQLNTYLRWASAYRAGGANSRSASFRTFDPEEVHSLEAGLHATRSDGRARLALNVFDMTYRDLQVNFFNPDNPVATETLNTDRPADIQGIEAEGAVALSARLQLAGSYTWSDVRIPAQRNPFTDEDMRMAPVYAPRHAATLELDLALGQLDGAPLSLHADAEYATGLYTYNADLIRSRPTLVVNARASLQDLPALGGRLSVGLWVRNLFNRPYELSSITGSVGPMVVFGESRSLGMDATWRHGRR